ncbi:transporter substrate-binding domain-containing protein [Arcobacter sp. LA11]|uniref:transporter substrate-binding domain-containing protein n=1 Tax=Arcobacter sp. LA11 TaxID=1898176 RepID=UPI000932672D|nr:transporter substrate-binding domain-containing protein [Arcobacter sp. LA11]
MSLFKNINLLLFTIIFSTTLFSKEIILTKKEQDFLKNNPTIILGTDSTWIPYVIKTDTGEISGYDNSILQKVNQYTGANFKLITGKWKNIVQKAKDREIDGLTTSAIHKEREKYFNFSDSYISSYRVLITSKKNPKNIKSIDDLEGKTIAIQEENLSDEKIVKNIKNTKIIKVKDYNKIIELLILGEVDATIGNETLNYYIEEEKLSYIKVISAFENSKLNLVFSIRNDWPEALSILNKGLRAIQKVEKQKIQSQWFLYNNLSENKTIRENDLYKFTKKEFEYIKKNKELTMCIDPDWMPFEKNDKGKHIGMTADYFKLIEKKTTITIKMIPTKSWLQSLAYGKQRKCDIFSLVIPTPEREEYLNFTKPYLEIPLVLATKTNELFINDITAIKNKKMGIVKGYAYGELLRIKYPNLQLVDVRNISDGLEKVSSEELFGFIGSLSTVGYNIQKNHIGQLKIAGKFDDKWKLSIGVRNDIPILTSILDKAISSISSEKHQEILNKWLSVKFEKVSYEYLFEILAFSLVIILAILFINRKLSIEVNKRKEVENYLNLIIKGAGLGTWTWNPQTNKNIINETWANIIGYTKEEIDKKNDYLFFILEEDKKNISKAFEEHFKGNKDTYETEFRMRAKDNSIKWVYSNGSIVQKDEEGKPLLIAGIHQDITEKKELEEAIRKQNDFIIQQSRQAAMGEMLENIAHQWRQPLSVITTSASGVKIKKELDALTEKELLEFMDQILKSGTYLSQTIEDFRAFFRKDKIHTKFTVEELFDKSLQFLKSKIINKNVQIIKSINDKTIYSCENELVQALINIFNNAVDALEKLEKDRYIFIEQYSDETNTTIIIKDNAGGIKEDIIYKIFDPYFTTKHKSQGTGIGLHMTREIIIKHLEGTIESSNEVFEYENKKYKGAQFLIKLPKKQHG